MLIPTGNFSDTFLMIVYSHTATIIIQGRRNSLLEPGGELKNVNITKHYLNNENVAVFLGHSIYIQCIQ